MVRLTLLLLLFLQTVGNASAQEVLDGFALRREKWQEYLEQHKFVFEKSEPGLISAIRESSITCEFHIVIEPTQRKRPTYRTTLKWVRDGREILSLPGHFESEFRTFDEKLYMAKFSSIDAGCAVVAYDLHSGTQLWEVERVDQLRQGGHSAYGNQVRMRLSRKNEIANELEGAAIIVTGHEGFGDYCAVLDRETGKMLAHKIYGRGFFDAQHPLGGAFGGEIEGTEPEPRRDDE